MATDDAHVRLLQRVVLALALGLRLLEYLRNDSLWGDEAMLALSIASRPFHALLDSLAYGQVAPIPFLWTERLMVVLFGANEWALRALPLVAAGALCVAVGLTARRIVRADEALVALVLVAFSQTLIRYSSEVKPYSADALVAVVLVWSAAGLIRQLDSAKHWWRLGGVGALAILLSLTSVFVCLAAGLAVLAQVLRERRARLLPWILMMGVFWAGLFVVMYTVLYRGAAGGSYMRSFWEGAFLVPGSPGFLARARVAVQEVLWGIDPGTALLGLGAVTVGVILLGTATLWRRGQAAHVLLLLTPGLAPFAASALRIYPIAARLMLFATPLLIILAGVGVMTVARTAHQLVPRLAVRWIAAVLLLPTITAALAAAVVQRRDQEMRPLVQDLTARWRLGDAVYVYHRVVPAWLFYSTNWKRPDTKQLAWAMDVSGPGGLGHENGPSRGPRRLEEGSELRYELGTHRVLLGTSTGVQGRPMFGYRPRKPDAGWATSESQRIRRDAHPRIWIVLGNAKHEGLDLGKVLLDSVLEAGGKLVYSRVLEDDGLYLFEFSPAVAGT